MHKVIKLLMVVSFADVDELFGLLNLLSSIVLYHVLLFISEHLVGVECDVGMECYALFDFVDFGVAGF